MLRSRLRIIFLKEKSLESKKAYNKQHNIFVKMVQDAKKEHFRNISLSEILKTRSFGKLLAPFLVIK